MSALCFPSPSEPECLLQLLQQQIPPGQAQVEKVRGKQRTASPKGKASPGPSRCEGCSMPAFAPSCAKRHLRLTAGVRALSRSVEQCKGHPKCLVETYLDTSASRVLRG